MPRAPRATETLVCPSCGSSYPSQERFCPSCRLPLTYPSEHGEHAVSERHATARKIKPQLAEGQLVRVAGARNQAEAEFIQGMLLEEGVPSILRRSAGFDVPDFLAAGPRDILVAQSGVDTARQVLLEAAFSAGNTLTAWSPLEETMPQHSLGASARAWAIIWS